MLTSPKSQRASKDAKPLSRRESAWRDVLAPLGLTFAAGETGLRQGDVSLVSSPTGARLARLRSSAQQIARCAIAAARATENPLLVGFHSHGQGRIAASGRALEFADGDLSVIDMRTPWSMDLRNDFELVVLELPRTRVLSRVGRTPLRLPILLGTTIAAAAVRPLMQSLANHFHALQPHDLPSAETAIVELVATALLAEARANTDGLTQVQSAHFRRLTAAIEARLCDPGLSMGVLAKDIGLSPRYAQRLFERHQQTFSDWLRIRRLERSRADLLDHRHADKSIADIAFRWGFRDQAYFSRSFSSAFGISPREVRKTIATTTAGPTNRGRPLMRPAAVHTPVRVREPMAASVAENGTVGAPVPALPDRHYHLAASPETVHWGYLSRSCAPVLRVEPDSRITIETLTQHAYDDYERMIAGDPAAESVFRWTKSEKAVDRRGAGPMNASVFGRGAGEGFGVHICTGPIFVENAEPGDVLQIEILDVRPRPSANPRFAGKCFASNAAAWWGYQYSQSLAPPAKREVITIFEIDVDKLDGARAIYSFRWVPQIDPFGVRHVTMDYPGIPIDHRLLKKRTDVLSRFTIPLRPHFGFIGVAPKEADIVDSIPPGYFGGNMDNWRCGRGATLYLPVSVTGALLSVGDGHLAQGDGEINGTGLEASLTGDFHVTLLKAGNSAHPFVDGLSCPLLETAEAWVVQAFGYPNYLKDLGRHAQAEIYTKSSVDPALRHAFRMTRRFLIEQYDLDEDDAVTLMSLAVDFGITQVADGNWGVHAIIPKSISGLTPDSRTQSD